MRERRAESSMKILLVGSGGREHAEAIRRSPRTTELFIAPGSDALAELGTCLDLAADDVDGLARFAIETKIDLTIVGPEMALVLGLADRLTAAGQLVFGPCKAA